MLIRKDTAIRVPVVLLDSSGVGVSGLVAADISGAVARIYKADGSASTLALSGANFFEMSAANAKGMYHILLGTGNTDVLGPMQVILNPAASAFETSRVAVVVEDLGLIATIKKVIANRMKIFVTGGDANKMVVYEDDETTVFKKFGLKDSAGAPTSTNPFERDPE